MSELYKSSMMELQPDWVDYNGHLNMAFYNVLFDNGCDGFFAGVGLGPQYVKERNLTFYTAEAHVRYLREIHLGDRVQVTMRIIDYDTKRIHAYAELLHQDGWVSASSETMSLHIDRSGPKVAPFPKDIMEQVQAQAASDALLPSLENIGRPIGIRKK